MGNGASPFNSSVVFKGKKKQFELIFLQLPRVIVMTARLEVRRICPGETVCFFFFFFRWCYV